MREQRGFTAYARAWRAFGRQHLEPAQRALADDLPELACWEPSTVSVHGREVRLDVGEALVSTRGLAESSGLSRDQVRRALARLESLGLIVCRKAYELEAAPPPAPRAAPPPAPPPTVVRVLRFREIFWPEAEAAPPPAPPPATEPAPIQHGNTGTLNPEKPSPAPAAPARAARRKEKAGETDPRHRPLQRRLEAAYLEARGSAYGFQPRDARALSELLRLSGGDLDEVERRWRTGLSESGFRRCDTLHELATAKWNAYVAPRASGGRPWRGDLGVEHGAEWWRRLEAAELEHFLVERKALDPELDDAAPFPATGAAATRQVEELIARYRGKLEQPRAAAGGAR